jgi:parvulin-like peptidyl-prolyl isomerase
MVPAFSQAVWALEPGQITTEPVKTQFGYHVIYLESKTDAKAVPYEQIKDRIVSVLKQKQFAQKIKNITGELQNKATIVDHTKKTTNTQ